MLTDVVLPEISENVTNGDVVKLLVAIGDTVAENDPLLELETDKAVFEVPSTASGVVTEIMVNEGDEVSIGQPLVKIDSEASAAPAKTAPQEAAVESKPEPEPKAEPKAAAPAKAAEPEASSPSPEAPKAPPSEAPAPPPASARPQPEPAAAPATGPAPASPTVRRLARELGIDIHRVSGTGPGGRISDEDLHAYAKSIIARANTAPSDGTTAIASARPLPDFSRYGEIIREPMSKIRAVTAANMASAWNTVPAVTQNDVADITDLEVFRKRYGKRVEAAGGKLTMTAILLKVSAAALKAFPQFNASIDVANNEVVLKQYYHVAVAVDTPHGLLVPVLRDVDRKSITELAVELADIAARARERKLKPDEMEGGNFTISNLGGIGGTSFSPIVNTPEVAILGVSRGTMQPKYMDGAFVPRMMMPLSLSYDHRLIDGAAAARFTRWIAEALEQPMLMAMG